MKIQKTWLLTTLLALCTLVANTQVKPIIGVAGISHESNSFSVHKTVLKDFNVNLKESREERVKRFFTNESAKTTSAGYIEGAKRFGLELYPTVVTSATPKGPLTTETFDTLMKEIIRDLKAGPMLQGILLLVRRCRSS
jgi:microcystin degradation protein MlrC